MQVFIQQTDQKRRHNNRVTTVHYSTTYPQKCTARPSPLIPLVTRASLAQSLRLATAAPAPPLLESSARPLQLAFSSPSPLSEGVTTTWSLSLSTSRIMAAMSRMSPSGCFAICVGTPAEEGVGGCQRMARHAVHGQRRDVVSTTSAEPQLCCVGTAHLSQQTELRLQRC